MPQSLSVYVGSHVQSSVRFSRTFRSPSASSITPTLSTIFDSQRLNIPNAFRVLLNASITCKETHSCHACDALANPLILVLVRGVDQVMRLQVTLEVVGDEVVVAMFSNAADEGRECSYVAKLAALNYVEDLLQLRVDIILAIEVCVAKVFNILCQIAEEKDVLIARLARDFDLQKVSLHYFCTTPSGIRLTFAPSQVPMIRPPFSTNFMLLVPLASVPAVEMCSLISDAGMIISALLTL